jgi:hypothetical protein
MKTIERIIILTGGLMVLGTRPLTITKPPFLPLRIRHLGTGPRDFAFVAVAQMIPSEGEDSVESEILFEIDYTDDNNWLWFPVCFRQESPALCQSSAKDNGNRGWVIDKQIEEGNSVIAKVWEEILVSRGYLELDPLG